MLGIVCGLAKKLSAGKPRRMEAVALVDNIVKESAVLLLPPTIFLCYPGMTRTVFSLPSLCPSDGEFSEFEIRGAPVSVLEFSDNFPKIHSMVS